MRILFETTDHWILKDILFLYVSTAMNNGVPQETILGPLLCIPKQITVFYPNEKRRFVYFTINVDLESLNQALVDHLLHLNPTKLCPLFSEVMLV